MWTDAGPTQIWRNDAGVFSATGEPGRSAGIDLPAVQIDGAACGDVDNDGDVDLFLSATEGPSYLFINTTKPGPAEPISFVRDNSGIDVDGNAPSIAFGDADRDGDLDLLVGVDGGINQLWENHRNDARSDDYLSVRALTCAEGGAYRDDIGATIRLFAQDGVTLAGPVLEVNGASGHGSQTPAAVHFGLPSGPKVPYVVEVRFVGAGAAGPVVRKTVVPNALGAFQSLEVKACPR